MAQIESFLTKFSRQKKYGGGWLVRCPAHDDQKESLSVTVGDQGGIVMYCHAGCKTADILAVLGLKMKDLAPEKPPTLPGGFLAVYDYKNVDGTLLYQVCRKPDKSFIQRRPDGNGGWIYKVAKQVKRVPYRLPELVNHPTVFIVEGEKDANNLWSIGIPATCNSGGAGKWGLAETKALKAAGCVRVVIIPDNDQKGIEHADDVATKCRNAGMAVTRITLPNLKEHGDVSDWLAMGNTKTDLESIVDGTLYVMPPPAQAGAGATNAPEPTTTPGGVHDAPQSQPADPEALADPTAYAPPGSDGVPHDIGAAEAFRDRYGHIIRYDHTAERWLLWAGHFWKPDGDGAINRIARQHVDKWQVEAMRARTYAYRAQLVKFVLHLDKRAAMDNMIASARWQEPIATEGSRWDADGWLLGVANGVVDLRTGQLREGKRDDWITKQAGAPFDPNAQCPRFLKFLDEVMNDDPEMVDYLHRALGYSLTGDMREQCWFLCTGTGSNGKSLLLDTLEHVFGSYGHRANIRIFIGNDDTQKYHIAELEGRRLIFAAETKPGKRINEDVVKNITGGETQSAERKFGHPFTFRPIGKLWLGVNHVPRVADDSFGFWRRIRMVQFDRTFAGSSDDKELKWKLRDEAAGILAWLVRGCLRWQAEGLNAPAKVLAAVEEYQNAEDPLSEFFAERCDLGPTDSYVSTFSSLFAAYNAWCEAQGISPRDRLSRRAMGNNLTRRFVKEQVNGVPRYRGIEVKAAHQSQEVPRDLPYEEREAPEPVAVQGHLTDYHDRGDYTPDPDDD